MSSTKLFEGSRGTRRCPFYLTRMADKLDIELVKAAVELQLTKQNIQVIKHGATRRDTMNCELVL